MKKLLYYALLLVLLASNTPLYGPLIIITSPGTYGIGQSFIYTPTGANDSIIEIASNNVILDLNQNNLTIPAGSPVCNGIVIDSGFNNIVIKNGQVNNITGTGIGISSGCNNIIINSVITYSCDTRGISLVGTAASLINNVLIQNCQIRSCCQGAAGDNALTFTYCIAASASSCIIENCGNAVNNTKGVSLTNCNSCALTNVEVSNHTGGLDFRAFDVNSSTQSIFNNCITRNCQAASAGGNARGFVLEYNSTATANIFENCIATGLLATASVDGFLSATTCNDNIFIGCQSVVNQTTGATTAAIVNGFLIVDNFRNSLTNCIALHNLAPNSTAITAQSTGFHINTCSNAIIHGCLAQGQSASTTGTSIGFWSFQNSTGATAGGTATVLTACSFLNNVTSNHILGFRLDFAATGASTDTVFTANRASKNLLNYGTNFAAGAITNANTNSLTGGGFTSSYVNLGVT